MEEEIKRLLKEIYYLVASDFAHSLSKIKGIKKGITLGISYREHIRKSKDADGELERLSGELHKILKRAEELKTSDNISPKTIGSVFGFLDEAEKLLWELGEFKNDIELGLSYKGYKEKITKFIRWQNSVTETLEAMFKQ
jgi:hypothetical protein